MIQQERLQPGISFCNSTKEKGRMITGSFETRGGFLFPQDVGVG
jgi:hypothetical protein